MPGRISLLVDSPIRDLYLAVREVPAEARKIAQNATKAEALPIWFEELRANAVNMLQQRVLVNSARVGVTARNVYLRSGGVGRLESGTPVSTLSAPAEWGANADRPVKTKSRKGKSYTRRMGGAFGRATRGGNVVRPAARPALGRVASLLIQTYTRTLLDALDLKGR